ncbi:MAG: AraC family transcriptional regulator [Hominilimicola sp.]
MCPHPHVYNTTTQAFLIRIRIDYARNILEHNNTIIMDELAMHSGFSSSYFCRILKKYTGMTPNEYRQYYSFVQPTKNIF